MRLTKAVAALSLLIPSTLHAKPSTDRNDFADHVTQPQPAPQPTDVRTKAAETRPQPVPRDSVQLSSSAQAALREALETPAQTAKEAGTGDVQAKRLLAKHAAAKEESAPPSTL